MAYQEAERAKFLVDRAEQEKRSSIIRAEGEARSAALVRIKLTLDWKSNEVKLSIY